jgi:hypothetical protein
MNQNELTRMLALGCLCVLSGFFAGCASSGKTTAETPSSASTAGTVPTRYKADDGRTIDIGHCSPANGGLSFKDPHLDKCWIADGFKFTGYDTLFIAPTLSTAKLHNQEEQAPHDLAKQNLQLELQRILSQRGIYPAVVVSESDIKPGGRVLKIENTILEYAKGGGAARYFAGLYGGGQPILRVQGKMTDGEKSVFEYEARRSGVSAGARMTGAFMKDTDIQTEDIRSLSLDLADFMSAVSGKFPPK